MQPRFTRRQFIQTTGMATIPMVMPAILNAATTTKDPGIALIGYGGRGSDLIREAAPYGRVVAICDVDEDHLAKAQKAWPEAKLFKDFRRVMELKEVDVVACATVDHWHVMVSIAALRAGKDVYCEKPLTLTFEEGEHIIRAVRETGKILQVGTQQRSEERFRRACECVRNGRIGKLRNVEVYIPEGPRMFPFYPSGGPPPGFDWEFWKGQTPDVPYLKERTHGTFRYWWDYSGGTLTDWGVHHNDIAIWGAGLEGKWPVKIHGEALAPAIPGGFTADSRFRITYTYADGLTFTCNTTPDSSFYGQLLNPDGQGHGIRFVGDDGWIWVTRGEWSASDREILRFQPGSGDVRLYESSHHMENFFDCVRSRKQPICTAMTGHSSAGTCHLGVISLRLGRELEFDPESGMFPADEEATSMLARPMRAPYDYSFI